MRYSMLAFSLVLAACAGRAPPTVVKLDPVRVAVPVSQPCVVGRPDAIVSLNRQMTEAEWLARATGAKSSTIAAQAYRRMNYGMQLEVATASCRNAL